MKKEWKAAIAANASGIAIMSGRSVAIFYSQTQQTSWLGVMTASMIFGVLCGSVCMLARKTGAGSLTNAGVCLLGTRFGMLIGVLCSLCAVVTGTVMLIESGKLAALALSAKYAREMGVLFTLGTALVLNIGSMRWFPGFGAAVIAVCVLFYAGHAMDWRPVLFYQRFETVAKLSGSVPAALLLACLHASLCTLVSADAVMKRVHEVKNIVVFSLKCAGIMLMLLIAVNAAVLRGGTRLLSLKYPEAALAARWGKIGFYICIFSMMLQNISTLCACIGMLAGLNAKHDKIPC